MIFRKHRVQLPDDTLRKMSLPDKLWPSSKKSAAHQSGPISSPRNFSSQVLQKTHYGRLICSGAVFTLLLLVVMVMPSGYLVEAAGPAIDVNSKIDGKPLVEIRGADTYESDTKLFMTTVSAWGNPNQGVPGAQAAAALFGREAQLVPVRAYYPKEVTAKEVEAQNTQLMVNSQDSAALLAFEMAGYPVSMDVKVVGVNSQAPSGKVLKPGDIIRGIGAADSAGKTGEKHLAVTPAKSHYELSKVLDRVKPGTEITLEIERAGKRELVSFPTMEYHPDTTGWVHPGSLLGVAITVENVKLPAEVKYLVDGIGGPSAGNMFALGIYDALTPGSLGGGKKIAGTGSVAWDGDIEPIGGITHKLAGASAEGATDFLAPAENCRETIGFEPEGMHIWAVRNTPEAVEAVKAIAAGTTSGLQSCKDIAAAAS